MGQEEWNEEEYMKEQQEFLERQAAFERLTQARMAAKGAGKRAPVGPYEGKAGGKSGPQPSNTSDVLMVNSFKGVPVSYGPLNPAPGQSSNDSMDTKDAAKRTAQDKEIDSLTELEIKRENLMRELKALDEAKGKIIQGESSKLSKTGGGSPPESSNLHEKLAAKRRQGKIPTESEVKTARETIIIDDDDDLYGATRLWNASVPGTNMTNKKLDKLSFRPTMRSFTREDEPPGPSGPSKIKLEPKEEPKVEPKVEPKEEVKQENLEEILEQRLQSKKETEVIESSAAEPKAKRTKRTKATATDNQLF
jgi:hypothetical protein